MGDGITRIYQLPWGTIEYSFGCNLSLKGSRALFFKMASKAHRFFNEGLEGLQIDDEQEVLPAIFKQIEVCTDFIYFILNEYQWRYYRDGSSHGERIDDDDPEGRLFAKDGMVGWMHGIDVVIKPVYDDVYKWYDFDVYFTRQGKDIKYFNRSGRQVLSKYPFEIDILAGNNQRVTLRSLNKGPKEDSVVLFKHRYRVRINTICREEIVTRLQEGKDILPLPEDALKLFDSKYSYEYSSFEAISDKEGALKDCLQQLKILHFFKQSWHYLVNIKGSSAEMIGVPELESFKKGLERLAGDELLSFAMSAGIDATLPPKTVKVFMVTYFWDRWPWDEDE